MPTSAFARHRGFLECSIPEARLARIDFVFVFFNLANQTSLFAFAVIDVVCVLDVNFRMLKRMSSSIREQRYEVQYYSPNFLICFFVEGSTPGNGWDKEKVPKVRQNEEVKVLPCLRHFDCLLAVSGVAPLPIF